MAEFAKSHGDVERLGGQCNGDDSENSCRDHRFHGFLLSAIIGTYGEARFGAVRRRTRLSAGQSRGTCFDNRRMMPMGARQRRPMKRNCDASRAAYGRALMAYRIHSILRLLALVAPTAIALAAAPEAQIPRLYANQTSFEATRHAALAIDDPIAVFAFVLGALPAQVRVYPTENYCYFSFVLNGTRYLGNIRLAAAERDSGKLRFEYYQETSARAGQGKAFHAILDSSHGVTVERTAPLTYRVTLAAKSVIFALEDLSGVQPPANAVGPHEKFLGPIIDESGMRFYLVYNSRLKLFHYVLDENSAGPDELVESERTERLLVGRRTGFAFYRDRRLDRRILIGVREGDSRLNTYFDGPFDQLPENFIKGESLRGAIIDSDPAVSSEIDRFGNFVDGSGRYLIHPYILYRTLNDLYAVHRCASHSDRAAAYYKCLASNVDGRGGVKGRPIHQERAVRLKGESEIRSYQHRRHTRQRRPL